MPHPAAITPGWQDPISQLPYHVIPVSRHDTPNTTLRQKAKKKECHKDCDSSTLIWVIIAATLGAQLVSYFRIHATHVCHAIATISKLPRLQTCTPPHILWPNVSL